VSDVSVGRYELEEPWGRLVEVARTVEPLTGGDSDSDSHQSALIRTYALKDRTTRASAFICKSAEDAVSLARFLDAHLAELRRFLLEAEPAVEARLRALDADVPGHTCRVTWTFSTGPADPHQATAAGIEALHEGFVRRLAPVAFDEALIEPELGGGQAVLAACATPEGERSLRLDLQRPSGPGYRAVQLTAAAKLGEQLAA
jgi:hypothetical protein